MTFCDEIKNAEFNLSVQPFLQHFRPFDNTLVILLPPSLAVGQPADVPSVVCCVTSRGCAYVADSLSLAKTDMIRLSTDNRCLLVHLMYISFYLAQLTVMLACLESKNYTA